MSIKFWNYPMYAVTGFFAFLGLVIESFGKATGVVEEDDEEQLDYEHEASTSHQVGKW